MRLSVRHSTSYTFSRPPTHGLQRLRLRPKPTHGQTVLEWDMQLEGAVPQTAYHDQHNNATTLVSIEPGAGAIAITCTGLVETTDNAGIIGAHIGHMPLWCFLRQTPLTRPGPKLRALVGDLKADRSEPLALLHTLSRGVVGAVAYEKGATDVTTAAEDALAAGRGVCQDHAHVFISAGRLLDIPMRYVSGYLKLEGAEAEQQAGHGWAEAHVDGLGWVGFDVANAICPDERYIRVATGCDYSEAAPVTGFAQGAGETTLGVEVSVEQSQSAGQQQQRLGTMTQRQKLD